LKESGKEDERKSGPSPHRFFLKHKGGDPRNHHWVEVGESEFKKANERDCFKKILKGVLTSKQ